MVRLRAYAVGATDQDQYNQAHALLTVIDAVDRVCGNHHAEKLLAGVLACRDLNDASSASHLRQIAITKASVTSYAESQSLINLPCTALQGRSTRPLSGIPYLEGCSKKDQD